MQQECKRQEERLRTEPGTSARDREVGDGDACGGESRQILPARTQRRVAAENPGGRHFEKAVLSGPSRATQGSRRALLRWPWILAVRDC